MYIVYVMLSVSLTNTPRSFISSATSFLVETALVGTRSTPWPADSFPGYPLPWTFFCWVHILSCSVCGPRDFLSVKLTFTSHLRCLSHRPQSTWLRFGLSL